MRWMVIFFLVLGLIVSLWFLGWDVPASQQLGIAAAAPVSVTASAGPAGALVILMIAGMVARHVERAVSPRKKLHGEV